MKALQIVEIPEQAAFHVSEAARFLGISPNTLRKKSDLGLIPARRDESGNRVFLLADLEAYLNSLPPYAQRRNPIPSRSAKAGR
ncbi:MAG: MerR family DNA-binding transcriptional regulator [Acidobacteria bacterium]|nr:MerR family DNA-binding transcriptional regulator [Acidobacteriota bacterium]